MLKSKSKKRTIERRPLHEIRTTMIVLRPSTMLPVNMSRYTPRLDQAIQKHGHLTSLISNSEFPQFVRIKARGTIVKKVDEVFTAESQISSEQFLWIVINCVYLRFDEY